MNKRTRTRLFISLIVAMVVLLVLAWYTWPQNVPSSPTQEAPATASTTAPASTSTSAAPTSTSPYPPPSLGEQSGVVTINGLTIYADLAINDAQQELGLGNRAGLGAHQGMLFIFPNDALHMFWMKDMAFSIDMIWFSADGTVLYIQPNVAPSTYPTAFGPNENSRYVLEVPANFATDYGITVGSKAVLP